MSVDEAIKQLSFKKRKGAHIIKEVVNRMNILKFRPKNFA